MASSPEEAVPAFPWLIWAAVWLWGMLVARVIHWEWLRGLSVAGAEVSGGEAALRQRNPPACGVLRAPGCYGPSNLVQKRQGGGAMLTKGSG